MTTLSYPITAANGGLLLTSEPEKLAPEVIKHVLMTVQEERVLNPEFGVSDQTFNLLPDIPGYIQELEQALAYGLQEYPEISVKLLGGSVADSGETSITCLWETNNASGEFVWTSQN